MARRVLLLGTTGVDKDTALQNLRDYRRRAGNDISNLVTLDFEHTFIQSSSYMGLELHSYLDTFEREQRSIWREAWRHCANYLQQHEAHDVIIAMHGVLVRPLYGVRSPIYIEDLKAFRANSIVTLIDDVYTMWHRTEHRAGQLRWRGRPTLAQLLDARRAEIFMGDVLATNLATPGTPLLRNDVLAVLHPARVLDRLVFNGIRPKTIYTSFPITGPRRLARENNSSGIDEVNDFLGRTSDFEKANTSHVFFCPLTIDELPLTNALEQALAQMQTQGNPVDTVELPRNSRWDINTFYGSSRSDPLLTNPDDLPDRLHIPLEDVKDAVPIIESDVARRDYRLVLQSNRLLVFNPYFQGEQSSGVANEIRCAINHFIPVHIYQDSNHDPEGKARMYFYGKEGSLGSRPSDEYVAFHNTLGDLFEALRL
jgi:hypothetical protein